MELIRRSGWGAAPPKSRPVAIATPVRDLFLHHSAMPDGGPETIRAIQRFHQDTRGWADIAYTWLYSPRDRVFYEGRGPGVAGAHTRNHNKSSHAVCVLGNYQASKPAGHVLEDLACWARWHGTAWGPDRYRGHRDVGPTACPGDNLYAMIRDINLYAQADITPSPTRPVDDTPATLRRGDRGPNVRLVQAAVGTRIDGIYGPNTEQAVRDYQARHGLTVDGVCGPQTWRSILGR